MRSKRVRDSRPQAGGTRTLARQGWTACLMPCKAQMVSVLHHVDTMHVLLECLYPVFLLSVRRGGSVTYIPHRPQLNSSTPKGEFLSLFFFSVLAVSLPSNTALYPPPRAQIRAEDITSAPRSTQEGPFCVFSLNNSAAVRWVVSWRRQDQPLASGCACRLQRVLSARRLLCCMDGPG